MAKIREIEENSLFQLIATNIDSDTRIKNSNCIQIQHVKSGQYLCVKKKAMYSVRSKNPPAVKGRTHSQNEEGKKSEDGLENTLFQPIEDSEINNAYRNVLEMKPQIGYEDAFFIQIIDKDTLKDILFVQTSIGILKKNIPYLAQVGVETPKDKLI